MGAFRREVIKEYQNKISNIEQFYSEFEKLVSKIIGNNGRMVVFIDDLDRCLPDKSLEVFEAIKLFVGVDRCHFFIGVDQDLILEGIKQKYGYGEDKSVENWMYEYLQKVIQIPYRLRTPSEGNLKRYFNALDPNGKLKDYRDTILESIEPNPRKIKLIINILSLDFEIFEEERRIEGG